LSGGIEAFFFHRIGRILVSQGKWLRGRFSYWCVGGVVESFPILSSIQEAFAGEAEIFLVGYEDMIQQFDIEVFAGFLQSQGPGLVL
jgi:hypothetical protein